jgi:hypothetical protein
MSTIHVKEDMTMKMKVIGYSKMIGYWATTAVVALELWEDSLLELGVPKVAAPM